MRPLTQRCPAGGRCIAGLAFLTVCTMGGCLGPDRSPGGNSEVTPSASLGGYRLFPADNPWNQDISGLPVHPNSASYLASIGLDTGLHPDFGTVWDGAPIGIPYVVVHAGQPKVPVTFEWYADESDPGPYPIPLNAPIDGGSQSDGDRHVIAVDVDNSTDWYISGAPDTRWSDDDLHSLGQVKGRDFEVVYTGELVTQ